jgi:hypothetical protein
MRKHKNSDTLQNASSLICSTSRILADGVNSIPSPISSCPSPLAFLLELDRQAPAIDYKLSILSV